MFGQIYSMYFSATGCTAQIVKAVAVDVSDTVIEYDLTLPAGRQQSINLGSDDLLIVGIPVYAGRVPAFLAGYLNQVKGNHAAAVCVVS